MRNFTDNCGRSWSIVLNVTEIGRLRDQGIDLLEVWDGKLLERLTNDPVFLSDALYSLVRETAEQRGVSKEEFGRALSGDVLDDALNALLEELGGFFPKWKRELFQKMLAKMRAVQSLLMDEALRRLESDEMEQAAVESLAGIAGS